MSDVIIRKAHAITFDPWKNMAAVALASALLLVAMRSSLRVGSLDDFPAMAAYAQRASPDADILQRLAATERWLTYLLAKITPVSGFSFYIIDKFAYPLWEISLAAMNLSFLKSVRGRLDLQVIVFALCLSLSETWLVLANFDIVTVSLITCFAATAVLTAMRPSGWRFLVATALTATITVASYQGFLYILTAMLTMLVISEAIRQGDFKAGLLGLTKLAAAVASGVATYFVLSGAAGKLYGASSTHIKFFPPTSWDSQIRLHFDRSVTYALKCDWYCRTSIGINWRQVTYAVAAGLILLVLARFQRQNRSLFLLLLPILLLAVLAMQPLQLLNSYSGTPPRAYGFSNYLAIGAIVAAASFLSGVQGPNWGWANRSATTFGFVLTAIMMLHAASAVHTFQNTRSRDQQIIHQLDNFYARNAIPHDAPLIFGLRKLKQLSHAGWNGSSALGSPLTAPWSYRHYIAYHSLLRPQAPPSMAWKDVEGVCSEAAEEKQFVYFIYKKPLVVMCF